MSESKRMDLELSIFGTATLGAVIAALKAADSDATVQFDFCYLAPTKVASYRGYYEHLALGWTDTREPKFDGEYWPQASALIAELESAIGRTFEGWKGGYYRMSQATPLWVANPGATGGTGIVGAEDEGSFVILKTAKVD